MALLSGDEPRPKAARDHRDEILQLMLSIEAKLDVLRRSPEAQSVAEEIGATIRELENKLRQDPPAL